MGLGLFYYFFVFFFFCFVSVRFVSSFRRWWWLRRRMSNWRPFLSLLFCFFTLYLLNSWHLNAWQSILGLNIHIEFHRNSFRDIHFWFSFLTASSSITRARIKQNFTNNSLFFCVCFDRFSCWRQTEPMCTRSVMDFNWKRWGVSVCVKGNDSFFSSTKS